MPRKRKEKEKKRESTCAPLVFIPGSSQASAGFRPFSSAQHSLLMGLPSFSDLAEAFGGLSSPTLPQQLCSCLQLAPAEAATSMQAAELPPPTSSPEHLTEATRSKPALLRKDNQFLSEGKPKDSIWLQRTNKRNKRAVLFANYQ